MAVAIPARRRWRWLRWWIAAGLVVAVIATTWAAGIVTSTTTTGDVLTAQPLTGSPDGSSGSRFDIAIDAVGALSIGFEGTWGTIANDTGMYEIDLTDPSFAGAGFYAPVYVLNEPSGWEWLQLQLLVLSGPCASASFGAPISVGILYVETADSKVDLTGFEGGSTYCVGVRSPPGDKARDTAASFIRRPNTSNVPVMPQLGIGLRQLPTS